MGHISGTLGLMPEAIEHRLPWGPVLRGVGWGIGAHTSFFFHEPGTDIDAWGVLPRAIASSLPVRAVAVDLPGHGLSEDPWEEEWLPDVMRFLAGAEHSGGMQIVIAAGASALAALDLAPELDFAGLVCLSPTAPDAELRFARSPWTPKLFFAGSLADDDLETARGLAASCGGWSAATSVPVPARGTALLGTEWQGRIVEHVVGFARDRVYPRTRPPG
jgi:pimeloyl-ACP methyl ester carboxylesterase